MKGLRFMFSHYRTRSKLFLAAALLIAQGEERFKIRFTPVPMDAAMRATVAGSGSGTATLSGNKLTINATFAGMPSAATTARVHKAVAAGVRGSAFLDLMVTKGTSGTVGGTIDLTPDQIDNLRKGHLYVQISSEKAPDGTLWGWILK
jgi:hypothetical protein